MNAWNTFKLNFASHLTRKDCDVLLTRANCPEGAKERISREKSPGRETLDYLEGKGIITPHDLSQLENILSTTLLTALQRCAKDAGISAPVVKMLTFNHDFGPHLEPDDCAALLHLAGCPRERIHSLSHTAIHCGSRTLDWLTQHANKQYLSLLTKYCFQTSPGVLWPELQSVAARHNLWIPNPKMDNANAFKTAFAKCFTPHEAHSFLEHSGCEPGEIQRILSDIWPTPNEGFHLPSRGALEWMQQNKKITFEPQIDLSFLALLCKRASPGVLFPKLEKIAHKYGFNLLPPTVQHDVMAPTTAAAAKPSLADIIQMVRMKLAYSSKLRASAIRLSSDFQLFFDSEFEHRNGFASSVHLVNPESGKSLSDLVNDSTGPIFYEHVSQLSEELILKGLCVLDGAEALRIAVIKFLDATRAEDADMIKQEREGVAKRQHFVNTVINALRTHRRFATESKAVAGITQWLQNETFDSWRSLYAVTCEDETWSTLGEHKPNLDLWMEFRHIVHTNVPPSPY